MSNLSGDPRELLGMWKSHDEVPAQYRMANQARTYRDDDLWAAYVAQEEPAEGTSKYYNLRTTGRTWKEHMDERGRHHAFPTPEDVEAYLGTLDVSTRTLYANYFVHLWGFFHWLLWHADYPHRYNPVLFAVLDGGEALRAWAGRLKASSTSEYPWLEEIQNE